MFKCPTEQKLNLIIAGSHEDLALKLRISKDCGLRPIEIAMLKARDIDTDHRSITPTTAKHGAPRALPISDSLNTTLKTYININNIKPDEILFKIASHSFSHIYRMTRNGVAKKLNDQTIKSIRLYVFRHYFGTMTYRRTQSTAHTAYCMGHKNWKNTQVHVDIQEILNSVGDEFNTAVAKTIEEACKLIADGWTVACEFGEAKIFKKRK